MVPTRKVKVYIIGPLYSSGTMGSNLRAAMDAFVQVRRMGAKLFIPHHFFLDLVFPQLRDYWLDLDLDWVDECDCAFRVPRLSSGGDGEEARMANLGRPTFTEYRELRTFIERKSIGWSQGTT